MARQLPSTLVQYSAQVFYYSASPVRTRYRREWEYQFSTPHPASHEKDFVPFHGLWIRFTMDDCESFSFLSYRHILYFGRL